MKKIDKKDILLSILLAVSFLAFVLIITHTKYYYGSTLDWESQHSTIPDMMRLLFYKTHNLFPSFAFNLGNGQNIYNFAYYGLLNPFILISYLLPFVKMIDYISIVSVIIVIASSIMFYFFERYNNKRSYLVSFLGAFVLMFATSISLHSHRHIMFMNYMPFLILGLFGVDRYFNKKQGWLLALSVFLIILTSYYYSIGSIICLILFGIYRYISLNKKITIKSFLLDGLKFIIPIIIGILSASIIILPTFYVILHNRGSLSVALNLKEILMPSFNIEYALYDTYGWGLTAILVLSIINMLFKKREKRFLGISLAVVVIFPIINYILNATMYIDSKSLIPLLPLAVLTITSFIDDLLKGDTNLRNIYIVVLISTFVALFDIDSTVKKYLFELFVLTIFILLFKKTKSKVWIIIPAIAIPFVSSFFASKSDELVKYSNKIKSQENLTQALNLITEEDHNKYRISNETTILRDVNNLYGNIDYNTSTLYSSTYDLGYNKFYYDTFNNQQQNRNRVITSATSNLLYLMFSSNKYLITKKNPYYGYEYVDKVGNMSIYKNDDVLPIAYAQSKVLSKDDFDKMSYPMNIEQLLNTVVVDDETNTQIESHVQKIPISNDIIDNIEVKDAMVSRNDDYIKIEVEDKATANIPLSNELKDKILFIRFDVLESEPCSNGDTSIFISGVENKLTCKSWKYHNGNYKFDYTIARQDIDSLDIKFTKGTYKIKNIELYTLDYDDIKDVKNNIDEFKFDINRTKGDIIEGDIDVSEDGYFVTSIPYDKGFKVYVDGQDVEYTKVNETFLGFKIKNGSHHVKIEYTAPLKTMGSILSLIGIISFIVYTFIQSKNKETSKK